MSIVKTLEFENEHEYELFMSGFTQAAAVYGQYTFGAFFGCDIPEFLDKFLREKGGLTNCQEKGAYMEERMQLLKKVVKQLDDQTLARATKEYNEQSN